MEYEVERRMAELRGWAQTCKYLVALFIGGFIFLPGQTTLKHYIGMLALFCMWSAYQLGVHVSHMQDAMSRMKESEDPEKKAREEQYLAALMTTKFLKIIRPS